MAESNQPPPDPTLIRKLTHQKLLSKIAFFGIILVFLLAKMFKNELILRHFLAFFCPFYWNF